MLFWLTCLHTSPYSNTSTNTHLEQSRVGTNTVWFFFRSHQHKNSHPNAYIPRTPFWLLMNSLQSLNPYINIKVKNMRLYLTNTHALNCKCLSISYFLFIHSVRCLLLLMVSLFLCYSTIQLVRLFVLFTFSLYFSNVAPLLVRRWFWFFTFLTSIFHCSLK